MPRKNAQHKARKRAAMRKIKGRNPTVAVLDIETQDLHNFHRAQVAAWAQAFGVGTRIAGYRTDRAEKWEATPGNG